MGPPGGRREMVEMVWCQTYFRNPAFRTQRFSRELGLCTSG